MSSYGSERPKRAGVAVAVIIVAAAVVLPVLIAVFSRSSNGNRASGLLARQTPRPTTTPTPKPDGYTVALSFGAEGTGPGFFKDEMELALDAAGQIYVSDDTLRVQRFDAAGNFLGTWTIPTETKWYRKFKGWPQKLLSARTGELYAVMAGVIMKFDAETGEALGAAHGSDYIHDAALIPGGGLLIVSQKGADDELVLMSGDGRVSRRTHQFVSSLLDTELEVEALRVAADREGHAFALYAIGDVYGEHNYDDEWLAVFKFSPDGRYVSRFGSGGREPGQFGVPSGLVVDNQGRVYVSEPFDKIHVYADDGRYLRTLKAPHGVKSMTFDSQNNLFIAGGNRVSKLMLEN